MDNFLKLCVPLHKFALEGNWPAAKLILDADPRLKHAAITNDLGTVLHVAAGTSASSETHVHFVQQLLGLLHNDHIALQDLKGNTAFCFAAAAGNMPVVDLLLQRNPFLPMIRGGGGVTPIQFAALQGRCEIAQYLYEMTKPVFEDQDWELLFLTCINTGNYGLALQMAKERQMLAFARDTEHHETALHLLAQKPKHHLPNINPVMKQGVDLQLVKFLWETILCMTQSRSEIIEIISKPSQLLFVAAEVGNFGFLSVLISAYPSLIKEVDTRNRSIIHIAVMNRHASIYNLIHEIGAQKDIIVTYNDSIDKNTLLHLAAKLAPPSELESVSGAAFQMSLELFWFEEVKKIMPPSFITMKNSEGLTASELFTKEHAELQKMAVSWMKATAEQCMLIATVIASGVFSAAINLPGGIDDITEAPNYLGTPAFLIFVLSDAAAFGSSIAAILIFFNILISRYAVRDFYKSLPLKLTCGLLTLSASITSMLLAFGSAFITYYHYRGSMWVPKFISVLVYLPALLLMFLYYSVWSEIMNLTDYYRSLFKRVKNVLE